MIKAFEQFEVWFITGAQLLYGGDAVKQVDGHSKEMVDGLNNSGLLPIKVIYAGTANSSKEIVDVMLRANNEKRCIGVITWMHSHQLRCGLKGYNYSINHCSTYILNIINRYLGTLWIWIS